MLSRETPRSILIHYVFVLLKYILKMPARLLTMKNRDKKIWFILWRVFHYAEYTINLTVVRDYCRLCDNTHETCAKACSSLRLRLYSQKVCLLPTPCSHLLRDISDTSPQHAHLASRSVLDLLQSCLRDAAGNLRT